MNWLDALFSRIAALWPFVRVMPWERAIRTTYLLSDMVMELFALLAVVLGSVGVWMGRTELLVRISIGFCYVVAAVLLRMAWPLILRRPPRVIVCELGPGMHRLIPWVETLNEESVVSKTYELPIQNITTKDDKSVTFAVNVTLHIHDVRANVLDVHDFEDSMHGTARIHLAQRTRDMTWRELLDNQKDLEKSLQGTLTTRLRKWGATVTDVGFTDLSHTRPYRIYGDSFLRHLL